MSDRAILFLFSVLMVIVALAASGWLLISGQAGTVDGLFLLITCLLAAFAFACYLMYMIHRALESLQTPAPKPAKAAAPAPKAAPAATTSQPASTS